MTWKIVLDEFNTWFTRTGGRGAGYLGVDPEIPPKVAAYLAAKLEDAEVWVEKPGSEGHVCGFTPRYVWGEAVIRRRRDMYVIEFDFGGGAWGGYGSVLVAPDNVVAHVNTACDGIWALDLLHDILLLLAGFSVCDNNVEFKVIAATNAYCRGRDP